jgi:hypothetical protein
LNLAIGHISKYWILLEIPEKEETNVISQSHKVLNICFHRALPSAYFALGLPTCQSLVKRSLSALAIHLLCVPYRIL